MKALLALLPLTACVTAPPDATGATDALPRARDEEPQANQETVDDLIASGRRLLEEGRPLDAEARFERAQRLDGNSVRTRAWVLRAWMDQGRSNETLDALDELARSGEDGPRMDYLYGMAFVRRAEGHLASGVTDSAVRMNYLDAAEHLRRAVEAEPAAFPDAYQPLASAAWFTQDLGLARPAAERAVQVSPEDELAWVTLGRVAMSQFVAAASDATSAGTTQEANAHWRTANAAFARALFVAGGSGRPADPTLLADAAVQLGHSLVWKRRRSEAADAYALAMAWTPDSVDYATIHRVLAPPAEGAEGAETENGTEAAPFVDLNRALEAGAARFRAAHGARGPGDVQGDATLLWWLGWSRLRLGRWEAAQEAFLAAVDEEPSFVTAWFHVAMARYETGDWDGVVEALRRGWEVEPAAIVRAMGEDPEANVARLEEVIGRRFEAEELAGCALLAEICAETAVDDARLWNNLGLFLRDEAVRIAWLRSEEDPEAVPVANPDADPEVLADLHERAYEAYSRALELEPLDPQLLNDTAVVLHYCLDRDSERALAMYERAIELADRGLAGALSESERTRFGKAREDARVNVERLRGLMARRAAGEVVSPGPPLD